MGKIWGDVLLTADLDGSTLNARQKFISPSNDVIVAIRLWLIFYNDPAFSALTLKIYSDRAGSPQKLLYTSTNSPTKASIITDDNGAFEFAFLFNKVLFRENETYHAVLSATGYTGTASSHIAWRKGWPDPVYRTGVDSGAEKLEIAPRTIYFVGAEL